MISKRSPQRTATLMVAIQVYVAIVVTVILNKEWDRAESAVIVLLATLGMLAVARRD